MRSTTPEPPGISEQTTVTAADQRRHLNLLIIITLITAPIQWALDLIF